MTHEGKKQMLRKVASLSRPSTGIGCMVLEDYDFQALGEDRFCMRTSTFVKHDSGLPAFFAQVCPHLADLHPGGYTHRSMEDRTTIKSLGRNDRIYKSLGVLDLQDAAVSGAVAHQAEVVPLLGRLL